MDPLANRVIILPDVISEKTAGGLFIPQTLKRKEIKGTVVFVSSKIVALIQPEERVLFPSYSGQHTTIAGKEYIIIDANELIVV